MFQLVYLTIYILNYRLQCSWASSQNWQSWIPAPVETRRCHEMVPAKGIMKCQATCLYFTRSINCSGYQTCMTMSAAVFAARLYRVKIGMPGWIDSFVFQAHSNTVSRHILEFLTIFYFYSTMVSSSPAKSERHRVYFLLWQNTRFATSNIFCFRSIIARELYIMVRNCLYTVYHIRTNTGNLFKIVINNTESIEYIVWR